jgi:hypothetical protein
MKQFMEKHQDCLAGTLSGFDRLRFRGTLLLLTSEGGMSEFLWQNQIRLLDFKAYVRDITKRVYAASERLAQQTPLGHVRYLASTKTSKEDVAQEIAHTHRQSEGPICVLSCNEPCRSFDMRGSKDTKRLRLHLSERRCLHHYFYFLHPEFGFMHVRLQTWFPFTIHVNLNGREWLARMMDRAQMAYVRRDNCFPAIKDLPRAQRMMDRQLRKNWPDLLEALRRRVHPTHRAICRRCPMDYYWAVNESEWATDVMFQKESELARLYRRLWPFAMRTFNSARVMRFLGRRITHDGNINGNFQGEVVTDVRHRVEGTRIKHSVKQNSIKMYDKQGQVLRVETTMIDPKDFRVYRPKPNDPQGTWEWQSLRKSVADLHRRADVCQAANARYLEALAAADETTSVAELSESVCQRVENNGRRHRALNPLGAEDSRLLDAVMRGEFAINGFRNRDLRALLFGDADTEAARQKQAGQITRKLTLLKAHGLIQKVSQTHRYVLTNKGRTTIAALLTIRQATTKQFTQAA